MMAFDQRLLRPRPDPIYDNNRDLIDLFAKQSLTHNQLLEQEIRVTGEVSANLRTESAAIRGRIDAGTAASVSASREVAANVRTESASIRGSILTSQVATVSASREVAANVRAESASIRSYIANAQVAIVSSIDAMNVQLGIKLDRIIELLTPA